MKTNVLSFSLLGLIASSVAIPAPKPNTGSSFGSAQGAEAASKGDVGPAASTAAAPEGSSAPDSSGSSASGGSSSSGASPPAGASSSPVSAPQGSSSASALPPAPPPPSTPSSGSPPSGSAGSGALTLPAGCMTKNGYAIGWLPEPGNNGNITAINDKVGSKACFYGLYSQVDINPYNATSLIYHMDDVQSSGAILQAAVMPTTFKFNQIDSSMAAQICGALGQFTAKGIEVWMRLAPDFNTMTTDKTYAGGSAQDFLTMWQTVTTACRSDGNIKMFWSPNSAGGDTVSSLEQWWPGATNVDVVGIDAYPAAGSSFDDTYGDFYKAYAEKNNVPFYIGETGMAGSDDQKKDWLQKLTDPGSDYPLYYGFSWSEYNKAGQDYRVVLGSSDVAKDVLG